MLTDAGETDAENRLCCSSVLCHHYSVKHVTEASSFSIESHRLKSLFGLLERRQGFLTAGYLPEFQSTCLYLFLRNLTWYWHKRVTQEQSFILIHWTRKCRIYEAHKTVVFLRCVNKKETRLCSAVTWLVLSIRAVKRSEFARLVPLINCNNDKWMLNLHWFKQNRWRASCTFYHAESYQRQK